MELRTDFEVAIVGAGPVGAALAVMLGASGIRTLLLDRASFPRDKPCGEGLMPAGVRVLEDLGFDLRRHPPIGGVTYRLPSGVAVDGRFARPGRGVRRTAFDRDLAEAAAATPSVDAAFGCRVENVAVRPDGIVLETAAGTVSARILVGADGQRSLVARRLGWSAAPRQPHRHALVGHLVAPGHAIDRVLITLLDGCELYLAPTAGDELLAALLGPRTALRRPGEPALDGYRRRLSEAHPELAGCSFGRLRGAGPFSTRPRTVAAGSVFLVGDAAGFLDPLTGDGITAGLLDARRLAALLVARHPRADAEYRGAHARAWRRRRLVSGLALTLSSSAWLSRRALSGLSRRPAALDRLLELNEGSRAILSLPFADWTALAGI